jgi:hypothetical protein
MSQTFYRQCKLVNRKSAQTAWIPERFAVMNMVLRLRINNIWEDGWKVVEVWQLVPESELPDSHS